MDLGFWTFFFAGFGATFGTLVGFVLGKVLLFGVRYAVSEFTGHSLE